MRLAVDGVPVGDLGVVVDVLAGGVDRHLRGDDGRLDGLVGPDAGRLLVPEEAADAAERQRADEHDGERGDRAVVGHGSGELGRSQRPGC